MERNEKYSASWFLAQPPTEEAKRNRKKNAQRVATGWRKLAKSKKYNWTKEFGRFGI